MNLSSVGLADMLNARERRVQVQQYLSGKYAKPVVCLTMNIAGPVKRTPLVQLLFDEGVRLFEERYFVSLEKIVFDEATGCEAFWCIDEDAEKLKTFTTAIECGFHAARLFDFDVLLPSGEKLSRPQPRECIVCGAPVQGCSRSRAHGLDAIKAKTNELLNGFASEFFASAARDALITEVHVTPKPGLVDERNNGSHKDMDLPMFEKSARSLTPYFSACVQNGLQKGSMKQLRALGLEAEQTMYSVTNGVNTHKGALFSMGLLLSGIGRSLTDGSDAFENVKDLLKSEEAPLPEGTNGSEVRKKYGCIGAYEEALRGFPCARKAAGIYQEYAGKVPDRAGTLTLCHLMADVDDTNVFHRGGTEGAAFMHAEAKQILALPEEKQIDALYALDDAFIQKNLSPGGCADLLAMAILICKWKRIEISVFK